MQSGIYISWYPCSKAIINDSFMVNWALNIYQSHVLHGNTWWMFTCSIYLEWFWVIMDQLGQCLCWHDLENNGGKLGCLPILWPSCGFAVNQCCFKKCVLHGAGYLLFVLHWSINSFYFRKKNFEMVNKVAFWCYFSIV